MRRAPRDSVHSGFVRGILASLAYRPGEARALLEHAQIAILVLDTPNARVPLAGYAALYRGVAEHLHDEAFGLLSRPLRAGCLNWLLTGACAAGQLGDALSRLLAGLNLLQDNVVLALRREADDAVLTITVAQPLPVGEAGFIFAHEWLLRLVHGVAAWLAADPLPLTQVRFPYPPPPHAADYEMVFAPRVEFAAPLLEARFPAARLALPVRRDAAALADFLAAAPVHITQLYRRERATAARAGLALRAALPALLTQEALAARLHLSPRTLHRRLVTEGTSFRALREALRRELALDWLARTERPVSRIAQDLGFADNTSFYRAFAQWQGCGPRQWRQQRRAHSAVPPPL